MDEDVDVDKAGEVPGSRVVLPQFVSEMTGPLVLVDGKAADWSICKLYQVLSSFELRS